MSSGDDYEECSILPATKEIKRDSELDTHDVMRPIFDNEQNLVNFALDDMLNAWQINGSEEDAVVLNVINKQTNPDTVEHLKGSLLEQTISKQKRPVGRPRKDINFQSYHGNSDTGSYQKIQRKKKRNRNHFTNEQRIQIAKYSITNGNAQAADYFSQMYGKNIAPYTVAHLKKCYLSIKENTSESNNDTNFDLDSAIKKRRHRKRKYTEDQKRQIVEYCIKHGSTEAAAHFSQVLNMPVPVNTVLALRTPYKKGKHILSKQAVGPRYRYSHSQREAIWRYSVKHGTTETARHFSRVFGHTVAVQTVASIKYSYKSQLKMVALQ